MDPTRLVCPRVMVRVGMGGGKTRDNKGTIMNPVVLYIRTTNDVDGYPRRAFMVLDPNDGHIVDVIKEAYSDCAVVKAKYPNYVCGPTLDVAANTYNTICKYARTLQK